MSVKEINRDSTFAFKIIIKSGSKVIRKSFKNIYSTACNSDMQTISPKLIYLTKKKLDGFYFSVISGFLRNPTYYRSIFIALVYVHHTHLFSTGLIFQITLYATETCFCIFARAQLRISSFASKLLCRHSILIAEVNSCINFNFCITIIIDYLSKIRGYLKL